MRDHDIQWDFWTLSPENAHQVAYLLGDRAIQKTWREINGYPSHTGLGDGNAHFTQEEVDKLARQDGDYHSRDLFNLIADRILPSWTLKWQVMQFEDAKTYRINPFDLTKVWPHADCPLMEVGKLTLNENPTDFHTQIEQAAFEPKNMVPSIGLSPDKMVLARGAPMPMRTVRGLECITKKLPRTARN